MATYIQLPVIISRERMDELHAARKAAGLSPLSDLQMLYVVVAAGETAELESLKLLTTEAAP